MPDAVIVDGLSEEEISRAQSIASRLSFPFLSRLWQMLIQGVKEVSMAQNNLAAAEMLILRIGYAGSLPTPDDLLKQLKNSSQPGMDAPSTHAPVAEPALTSASAAVAGEIVSLPSIENLALLVDCLAQHGENFLASYLHDIHVIKYDTGKCLLEFSPVETTPRDFSSRLSEVLQKLTNHRWMVVIAEHHGEIKTLRMAKEAQLKERESQLIAHPLVEKMLSQFPGSEVVEINLGVEHKNNDTAAHKNDQKRNQL